mmetsp:Transcript_132905/g.230952  ORF Transcript_132905/g.230952 Transcript_132905/m.230952 type:complete len:281 (+) Transcript_132905:995-1837(+)
MLSEVWADWRKYDQPPFKVPHHKALVRQTNFAPADVSVIVKQGSELVIPSSQGLTVVHGLIMLFGLDHKPVHLICEPLVHKAAIIWTLHGRLFTIHEHLQRLKYHRKFQDGLFGHLLLQVGILKSVTCIRTSQANCVCSVHLHDFGHGEEVALGLRHLLTVNQKPAVAEHAPWPQLRLFLPDAGVVVQAHGQVVLDEILARYPQVHRVPVPEFLAHLLEDSLLTLPCLVLGHCTIQEDVVKHVVGQLLRFDARRVAFGSIHYTILQDVGNAVVGHVDRAV